MKPTNLLALIAVLTTILGPACGGSTESSSQETGGGGGLGGSDAHPDSDGGAAGSGGTQDASPDIAPDTQADAPPDVDEDADAGECLCPTTLPKDGDPCCKTELPYLNCKLHDCEKAERTYFGCGLGKWSVGATAFDVPCSDSGS